jgi:XTP/dITP diphosphohydrolase
MKHSITFVTTNAGKFQEVQRWINQLDQSIILEQAAVDIPEYQSADIHYVAVGKAQEAWRLLQKPVLIDDGGIYIEKYNHFPGPLSKYVFQGIGLDGIWLLAKDNPSAYFLSYLVYIDNLESYHCFSGVCKGTLIEPHGFATHTQLPYTAMFVPEGKTKTIAQLQVAHEEESYHHRFKAIKQLIAWLNNR